MIVSLIFSLLVQPNFVFEHYAKLNIDQFEIKQSDNFGVLTRDTIIVDENIETPQMYVYHEYFEGKYIFSEGGSSSNFVDPQTLKSIKTKKPFTGVLILINRFRKIICPFTDGIPNGMRKQFYGNGNIESEIPVKYGFYHGECKIFKDDGRLYKIGHYSNGYPDGIFIVYNYSFNDSFPELFKVTLKTIINDPLKANQNYLLNKRTTQENRNEISGVNVGGLEFEYCLPSLTPSSGDHYWLNLIGCLNIRLNPLPITQTIIDGEFAKKEILEEGPCLAEKSFWRNGKCISYERYNHYDKELFRNFGEHVIRKSSYQYFKGYFIETRVRYRMLSVSFSETNICHSGENVGDLTFSDTIVKDTVVLINGKLKHGKVSEFEDESTNSYICAPECKFFVYYNYYEGEYYLNTKVGQWKYYIVANGYKKLVCIRNYKRISSPKIDGFVIYYPFNKLCDINDGESEIINGEDRFYRLDDGKFYIGYRYKDGVAIKIIKE